MVRVRRYLSGEPKTTDVIKERATFNFFNLPRELRDAIYEDLLVYKQKLPPQHSARLRARRAVQVSLLLVCRQFRSEYLARAEQKTCLIIVDRPAFHGEPFKLPRHLGYVRRLDLHLALVCCDLWHAGRGCRMLREVRMHRQWIEGLSRQMRHLDSISIKILIDPQPHVDECEKNLLSAQHKLTTVEELVSLEVYRCDFGGTDDSWNFLKERKLIMKLSNDGQELVRVRSPSHSEGGGK